MKASEVTYRRLDCIIHAYIHTYKTVYPLIHIPLIRKKIYTSELILHIAYITLANIRRGIHTYTIHTYIFRS